MSLVGVSTEGGVSTVVLQRPEKMNALSRQLLDDLDAALGSHHVANSRCLIITGSRGAFSAGADLTELANAGSRSLSVLMRPRVHDRLASLSIPTVAAISGYCLGGGLELALASDIRIAEEDAVFGLPEVALGTIPSWGGLMRLTRLVGSARATELALLGERLPARSMHQAGLLTAVVSAGQALSEAQTIAHRLAALPPEAVAVCKTLIRLAAECSMETNQTLQLLGEALLSRRAVDAPVPGRSDLAEA